MKMKKLTAYLLILALALGCAGALGEEYAPKLAAPAGAPAVAVATLAAENPENYTFLEASTIGAEFQKNESDFIIAPVNAGAKLFKAGKSTYRLAAVVTWGNLFLASQRENFSLETLKGTELVLFGENTVNAAVTLAALKAAGAEPASVRYLAGAAETQAELLTNPEAVVVTADPAVTAAKIKNEKVQTISVQELLKEHAGMDGFAQAGLFVRKETAEEHPEAVEACLKAVAESAGKAETDPEAVAQAAVALEILPNPKVALAALPGCSIRYVAAADAKAEIEKTASFDLSQFGGEVPGDDFYFTAQQ